MNLLDLLLGRFLLSSEMMKFISGIDLKIREDFSFRDGYVVRKTVGRFLIETTTQRDNAVSAGVEIIGFDTLINSLSERDVGKLVNMIVLGSESWGGQAYFCDDNSLLGVVLGRKRRSGWVTPSKWDGSEEMLVEHNVNLRD
ncbi:hypothetical protein [Pseudomonas citronellolis]|uniref:hypothetical protein n=1 Tax=Pseudomonas citronellolis TaxID=53408 RepID=UPI00248E3CA8|nr:hypothetical protein [Pseudomonas citronellolis]